VLHAELNSMACIMCASWTPCSRTTYGGGHDGHDVWHRRRAPAGIASTSRARPRAWCCTASNPTRHHKAATFLNTSRSVSWAVGLCSPRPGVHACNVVRLSPCGLLQSQSLATARTPSLHCPRHAHPLRSCPDRTAHTPPQFCVSLMISVLAQRTVRVASEHPSIVVESRKPQMSDACGSSSSAARAPSD